MKDEMQDKLMEIFRGVCDGSIPVDQAVAIARVAREHTRRDERRIKEFALRFEVAKAMRAIGADNAVLPTMDEMERGVRRIEAA